MDIRNDLTQAHDYKLIASAVAGRIIIIYWHTNPRLPAYTDGQSIYLPIAEKNKDQTASVICQALLIRSKSLRRVHMQRLVGKSRVAERFCYLEICRATAQFEEFLPRKFCQHQSITQCADITKDSDASMRLAMSDIPLPSDSLWFGKLRPLLVLRANVLESGYAPLSEKQQAGNIQTGDVTELDEADEEDAEESRFLKLLQNPLTSGGMISDMLNKILGAGTSGNPKQNTDSSGGSDAPVSNVIQTSKKGVFATLTELAVKIVAEKETLKPGSKTYPEWDYLNSRYRDDWTVVDEMDPWRTDLEANPDMATLQPPSINLLKKLAGIGLSLEQHHNYNFGEDIALDRIIDYVIDLNMGITPDQNIYSIHKKTRRDLAVMVLLDISGSTAEKDTLGLSVHQKQIKLAYHMTCALHELGDQVSCYAFHSWGKSLVRLLRIKSFSEKRIDSRMQQRISMLEPSGYTRTGAALRHSASKLTDETGMPYRILIVITDGFSYDHGYEGKYGEEDTRKALEEIRASGVGCLCLTIGSSQEEEKLKAVYGAASTLSVNNYHQFLTHLRPAMLNAIKQLK